MRGGSPSIALAAELATSGEASAPCYSRANTAKLSFARVKGMRRRR